MENVNKLIEQVELESSETSDNAELRDPRFTTNQSTAAKPSNLAATPLIDPKHASATATAPAFLDSVTLESFASAANVTHVIAPELAVVQFVEFDHPESWIELHEFVAIKLRLKHALHE